MQVLTFSDCGGIRNSFLISKPTESDRLDYDSAINAFVNLYNGYVYRACGIVP